MSARYRAGHLGEAVDHYVDGTLDADSSRRAARHLLVCSACRREVDAERTILAEVRAVHVDPQRHACLVAGLLALEPKEEAPSVEVLAADTVQRQRVSSPGSSVARSVQVRRPRRVSRAVTLAAAAMGSAAAVVMAIGTAHQARPVAPQVAHERTVDGDVVSRPRVVTVMSGWNAETSVVTANRSRSGRMAP